MKKYFEFIKKCVDFYNSVDSCIFSKEKISFDSPVMPQPKFKKTLPNPEKIEKIYKTYNEIQEILNQLQKKKCKTLIIEKIKEYDRIERMIIFYLIGIYLDKYYDECFGSVDQRIQKLLWLISKGDDEKFIEMSMKYLFLKKSRIYRDGLDFRNYRHMTLFIERMISDEVKRVVKKDKKAKVDYKNLYQELYDYVSKKVIGHENIKKQLVYIFSEHYLKIVNNKNYKKENVLLIGPTGIGKTLIIKTIAEYLDLPFVYVDITDFSDTGYVGRSVSDIFFYLYEKAGRNKERAEKGIIFIDEIDKIAEDRKYGRDVSKRAVQEELLNIIEGKGERWFEKYDRFSPPSIYLNVEKIMFVAAGAFTGLENYINTRKSNIGFLTEERIEEEADLMKGLERYGLLPELIGRFSFILKLDPLTRKDYVRILTESEISPLKEYEKKFEEYGIKLILTENAINEIAEKTEKIGLGARGLKIILGKILEPYLCEIIEGKLMSKEVLIDSILKECKKI